MSVGLLGGKELDLLFSGWRVVVLSLKVFVVISASARWLAFAVFALVFAGHSIVAVIESCEAEGWKQLFALSFVWLLILALEASRLTASVAD